MEGKVGCHKVGLWKARIGSHGMVGEGLSGPPWEMRFVPFAPGLSGSRPSVGLQNCTHYASQCSFLTYPALPNTQNAPAVFP